jgi:hypothetical protein
MNETADILVRGLVMNRVDDCHSLYYDLSNTQKNIYREFRIWLPDELQIYC